MLTTNEAHRSRVATGLALVAGVAYCSWPLGYLLNPAVSRRGLASELGAAHQPYNWVFIWLDVLAGALVCAAVAILCRRSAGRGRAFVLVNFALFGVLTAVDALLPMTCEPSLTTCPSFTHQPLLIVHGVASISASICLFLSAVVVWWWRRKDKGSAIMAAFMAGWTLFGLVSLYFLFLPGPGYLAQHYYITLCSAWMIALPFMLAPRS